MPAPLPEVMDFLLSRRSCPAKTLRGPIPDRAALLPMLTAAARVPDHSKLEPWRFIVLSKPTLERLAELANRRATALVLPPAKIEKTVRQFADADLVVAVIAAPVASEKVPQAEQFLSAGAACLALLNAALASGWGANWLTGSMATDREFLTIGLNLAAHEFVAGFIHIGTASFIPADRPRPDIQTKTEWSDT